MGLFGPPNVEKLAAKRDLKGLAKALMDDDPEVREKAGRALEKIDDSDAVPLIVDRVNGEQDEAVIAGAARVLHAMGDRAVPVLAACLGDEKELLDKRSVCGAMLGRMGEKQGLVPLLEASHETDPAPRGIAALSLGLIGDLEASKRIIELFEGDEDMEVRGIATVALADHKLPGAYETLVAALDGPDPLARTLGATGLGILGDDRAVQPPGRVALEDDDERVRSSAQDALNQLQA
jgi:HEAT repeat protein